jgi:hypothetical protein
LPFFAIANPLLVKREKTGLQAIQDVQVIYGYNRPHRLSADILSLRTPKGNRSSVSMFFLIALAGGADNRSFHFTQIVRAPKYDRVPHASVCEACGF